MFPLGLELRTLGMKVLHSANYPTFSEYRAHAGLDLHPYIKAKGKGANEKTNSGVGKGQTKRKHLGGKGANEKTNLF